MSETTAGRAPVTVEQARMHLSDAIWRAAQEAVSCNGKQPCQVCAGRVDEAMTFAGAYAEAATAKLRDGITALLGDVTASADATRPSKKTALEDEFAIALRKLLEAP